MRRDSIVYQKLHPLCQPARPSVKRMSTAVAAACLLGALAVSQALAGDDIDQRAVINAHQFLKTEQNGRNTLAFLHFGADYHGHEYRETLPVLDGGGAAVDGRFKLVYRFKWEDDGITDLAYLCDAKGNVYAVQVLYTNALFNQPYVLANGAIKLLGSLMIEANKKNMTDVERKLAQELVDRADAKGLLELSVRLQQVFGN